MQQKRSNSEIILEAIQDLHAQEQIVTRETLADVTGLKMTVIDDRVAILVDDGLVHRVQRGVFVPAPQHKPARLITKTMLPGGGAVLEIGDDHAITLTPREARMVANAMLGDAKAFSEIELGHNAAIVVSELKLKIRNLEHAVRALRTGADTNQLPLMLDSDPAAAGSTLIPG